MEQYSIGVTGKVLEGFEPAAVQQRLADLFKCSLEKAQRLISGKPVMLKSGLDRQAVEHYRQQLLKVGVEPAIKKLPATENLQTSSPNPPPAATTDSRAVAAASPGTIEFAPRQTTKPNQHPGSATVQADAPAMECPKCGARQPRAEICAQCGIVIAKYRGAPTATVADQRVAEEPPSELEELGDYVGPNFSAYRHKFQELIANQGNYSFHWHWPAFFLAFPWLLYRKMYLFAALLVLLALTPVPFLGLALPFLCGAMGNYLYFRHCRRKLAAVHATGTDRYRAIASTGGTLSIPATILASVLVSVLVSYAGYQLIYKDRLFQDRLHQFKNDQQLAALSLAKGEAEKRTLGRMMALGGFLRVYIAAEKLAGKPSAPPESMADIQRTLRLQDKDVSDEWGTQLQFVTEGEKSMLLSAGPDREFSTPDDLSYEIRLGSGR